MNIFFVLSGLFILSLILAVRDAQREQKTLDSLGKLKIKKKRGLSGTILFMKKKIRHYSSGSS